MATCAWTTFVVILVFIEETSSSDLETKHLPFTRSLGFTLDKSLGNLENARINREFVEQYQEMMKASQDSFESENLDKRIRRVIGDEYLEKMENGMLKRRRRLSRMETAVGRRRSRSQISRRNKLNSQSLRSHLQHSKNKSAEDYSESLDIISK